MSSYPKFVDLLRWLTVILAVATAVVALAGVASVLYAVSPAAQNRADEMLHGAYYVVRLNWTAAIPFGLCLLLASGVGFLGYSMTKQSFKSRISTLEQANSSQQP